MATKVHMEALSPTMEEGRLAKWLKNEGDQVKEGDVLAEIETDKATMELVARGSGVLRARNLAEGESAPVGTVIGIIAAADEDIGGQASGGVRRSGEGRGEEVSVRKERNRGSATRRTRTPDRDPGKTRAADRARRKRGRPCKGVSARAEDGCRGRRRAFGSLRIWSWWSYNKEGH